MAKRKLSIISRIKNWWLDKTAPDPNEKIPYTATSGWRTERRGVTTKGESDDISEAFFGKRLFNTKKVSDKPKKIKSGE